MILLEETDNRFYLDKSSQPHAGTGVFASEPIKAGDCLEIIGVFVKVDSVADKCTEFSDTFKFAGDYGGEYNQHIIPMGFGGMINHANNPEDQNVEIRHLPSRDKKNPNSSKTVYFFTKGIDKGQEVLSDYGRNWSERMDWVTSAESLAVQCDDEWETFLSHDLYNLGLLKQKFSYADTNTTEKST